jgi:hypothetical protein
MGLRNLRLSCRTLHFNTMIYFGKENFSSVSIRNYGSDRARKVAAHDIFRQCVKTILVKGDYTRNNYTPRESFTLDINYLMSRSENLTTFCVRGANDSVRYLSDDEVPEVEPLRMLQKIVHDALLATQIYGIQLRSFSYSDDLDERQDGVTADMFSPILGSSRVFDQLRELELEAFELDSPTDHKSLDALNTILMKTPRITRLNLIGMHPTYFSNVMAQTRLSQLRHLNSLCLQNMEIDGEAFFTLPSTCSVLVQEFSFTLVTLTSGTWKEAFNIINDRFRLRKLDLQYIYQQDNVVDFDSIHRDRPQEFSSSAIEDELAFGSIAWSDSEEEQEIARRDRDILQEYVFVRHNDDHRYSIQLGEDECDSVSCWLPEVIERHKLKSKHVMGVRSPSISKKKFREADKFRW